MDTPNYCPLHDMEWLGEDPCPDCRKGKPSALLSAEEQERIRLNVRQNSRHFIRNDAALRSMYDAEGRLLSPVPTREV